MSSPVHRKRSRVTAACDFCIARKIKCDGVVPSCGQCSSRKRQCVWTKERKVRGPAKGTPNPLRVIREQLAEVLEHAKNPQQQSISIVVVDGNSGVPAGVVTETAHQHIGDGPQQQDVDLDQLLGADVGELSGLSDVVGSDVWGQNVDGVVFNEFQQSLFTPPETAYNFVAPDESFNLFSNEMSSTTVTQEEQFQSLLHQDSSHTLTITQPEDDLFPSPPSTSSSTSTTTLPIIHFAASSLPPSPTHPTHITSIPPPLDPLSDLPPLPPPTILNRLVLLHFKHIHPFIFLFPSTYPPLLSDPMVLLALQAASSRFLPSWSCPQSHQVACYERAKRVVVPYLAGGGRASLGALQAMLFVFVFASTGEGQHAVDVVVRWMALIVQVAREMGINEDPEDGDVDGEGEGGRNRRDSNGDWRVDEMRRRTWWAIFLLGVSIPILAGIPPIVFAHECADLRIMQPIHVYDKAPHTDSSTGPPPAPPARPTFRTLIESPLPDLDDWSSVTLYQFYLLHLCGHAHADLSMPDTPDQRAQRIQCIESKLSILEVSLLALDAPRAGFGEGFGGTWKHLLLALSWVLLHLPVRASIERVMGMSPKQASGKDKEALARWVRSDSGATCERKGGDFVALLEHVMSVTGGMGDREYGGWLDLGFPVVDWGCFFIGMIHLAMATCPSPDPGRISARECIRRATVCLAALRMSGKVWLDMKVFAAGLEGMCSHVETLVPADQAATLPSATLTHMVGGADHTIPLGWGVPTARNVEASFEDVLAEVTDTSPSSDGWI